MSLPRAELALPDARAARRRFDSAAATFERAAAVFALTRERLLERLDYARLSPALIVDLGCALGRGAVALQRRYPGASVLAVDASLPMLRAARAPDDAPRFVVCGDAERIPLGDGGADLVLANMLLPWTRPDRVLAEAARILSPGGLLLFATLGPDSLQQVRRAWWQNDDAVHVHAFFDMHDLGDLALKSGLAEPVLDVDRIVLTYRDVDSMVRDFRSCGATNVAAGRRRTLTGARRWRRFADLMEADRHDGRFAVTLELILGQAWGRRRPSERGAPSLERAVPVADVGIMRRSRR